MPPSTPVDDELPDAPAAETPPPEGLSDSPVMKEEPADSPPVVQSPPKTADNQKDVKALFDDDSDEDLIGDTDDADLLASEAMIPVPVKPDTGYSDTNVMYAFYQRLFPWRHLFQWLNHSPIPTNDFCHREFAFTLQNQAYLRFQSFPTFEALRKDVLTKNPSRFEIGPVYSANPRDRKSLRKAAFYPLQKELVFDIDLTDYDDTRTCCDKANICNKCWKFITVAIRIMDAALREDLGFKHIMWVYSGRRGAHAWISDKRARMMDDSKRKAVASYLEVVKGGKQAGKKVNLRRPLHPHLARSLVILKETFSTDILRDQDPWQDDERAEHLLQLLPDKTINDELRTKWQSSPGRSSTQKWADVNDAPKNTKSKTYDARQYLQHREDIVFEYLYPRLDIAVSEHLNHLLKSPFVVHPGTGRVCVPIDSSRPEEFDPLVVPTVTELLAEIDEWDAKGKGDGIQDYEKTRMKGYMDYFKRFVAGLLKDESADSKKTRVKVEGGSSAMEF